MGSAAFYNCDSYSYSSTEKNRNGPHNRNHFSSTIRRCKRTLNLKWTVHKVKVRLHVP